MQKSSPATGPTHCHSKGVQECLGGTEADFGVVPLHE